jgi:hypothetical protein
VLDLRHLGEAFEGIAIDRDSRAVFRHRGPGTEQNKKYLKYGKCGIPDHLISPLEDVLGPGRAGP